MVVMVVVSARVGVHTHVGECRAPEAVTLTYDPETGFLTEPQASETGSWQASVIFLSLPSTVWEL